MLWFRTSEWDVSRHRHRLRPQRCAGVETPPGHHRCRLEGQSQAEVARTYGVSQGWVSRLLARYRPRATRRSSHARGDPGPLRPQPPPTTVELIVAAPQGARRRQGLDAGPDTIGWHLAHHHQHHGVPGHDRPAPDAATGWSSRSRRSDPKSSYIRFAAEQPNEMLAGRLHPLPAHPPDGHRRRHRDPVLARRPLPLRAVGHRPPPGHRPDRARPRSAEPLPQHGIPASTLTDNGMVFTTRLSGGKGGRNGFETELRRLGVDPEELPPQPPHHLRQGRTLPADPEEVAPRPTRPAHHPRRAASPARPLRRRATTSHRPHRSLAAPGHPRHRLHQPDPKPPPATAPTTPTTGSATTASTRPARSPCATAATSTPSASAEPTPEPASSCSSTTSTSASSTPPPANSSATSPSTPPSATKAPADHPAPPAENERTAEPLMRVRPSAMS